MYQLFIRTMLGLDLEDTVNNFETGLDMLRRISATGNFQFWYIKRTSDNVTLAERRKY